MLTPNSPVPVATATAMAARRRDVITPQLPELAAAAVAGAQPEDLLDCPVPESFIGAHLRREDVDMFEGVADKDVRKSIAVGPIETPDIAPDEVLVAVMASAINHNTVWSAIFEPMPTFAFLDRLPTTGPLAKHRGDVHVLGSDAAGVVVRVGAAVQRWKVGDQVVVSPAMIDGEDPIAQHDGMLSSGQRAWGFETNFGGLAQFTVVKGTQLLPKAPHLTWEEAAVNTLCAMTSYRMLVGEHGARIKQGDIVLIWGATGGLGSYAVQLVRNGGGIAVGVVSTPETVPLAESLGCELVIDRSQLTSTDGGGADTAKEIGRKIRARFGEDPHVVFDYVGRATFGASVRLARPGGIIVTCGSSTGYQHEYDNRYLWMRMKRIIGSHGANYQEAAETNRLISLGRVTPMLSEVYPLHETGAAARKVQRNEHIGKIGVLCCAPERGMGITDHDLRARIGEQRIRRFQAWR